MKTIVSLLLALTSFTLLAQPIPSLVVIQPPTPADPISIKVAWNPSPDANIINYRILWSTNSGGPYDGEMLVLETESGSYTNRFGDVLTNVLTATVTNLHLGATNHMTVTAVSDIGIESVPPDETEVFIPAERTSPPSSLKTAWLFTPEFEVSDDLENWEVVDGTPTVLANVQKDHRFSRFKGMRQEAVTQLE